MGKPLKVDDPLGTRNDRALLERIEKDRIYQAGGAVRFDQNGSATQQGKFHETRLSWDGFTRPC